MSKLISINKMLTAFANKYNQKNEFSIWFDNKNKNYSITLLDKESNKSKVIIDNLELAKAINITKSILESR